MIAGPVFYRRLVSSGAVDRAFAQRIVDRVLAAYANDRTRRTPEPRHGAIEPARRGTSGRWASNVCAPATQATQRSGIVSGHTASQ